MSRAGVATIKGIEADVIAVLGECGHRELRRLFAKGRIRLQLGHPWHRPREHAKMRT